MLAAGGQVQAGAGNKIGAATRPPCEKEHESARARSAPDAAHLGNLIEAWSDCVFTIGPDWRFLYANRQAMTELGVGVEVIGQHILDAFPRLSQAPFWSLYQRVMNERVAGSMEGYSYSFDAWFEVQAAPIDGGIAVFFRNITARKRAERMLRAKEETLRTILDSVPQMLWSSRPGRDDYFNARWYEFTGVALGEADGLRRLDLVHPEDRAQAGAAWRHSLETGEPYECEYRLRHHSGEYRWIFSRATPERDETGAIVCWYGTVTDIHQSVAARKALSASEALNHSIVQASADTIKMLDLSGRVLFVNDAGLSEANGEVGADPVGGEWLDGFAGEARQGAARALAAAQGGGKGHFTARNADGPDGHRWADIVVTPVLGVGGRPERLVVISRDVTAQKKVEEQVRWSARHDVLTGLANRAYFQDRLSDAIARAKASGEQLGLLLLDLDDFKLINDTLGHDAGDALLRHLAQRLRVVTRPADFVARLGGDEFAIILEGVRAREELVRTSRAILARLREPIVHDDRLMDCHASIGASLFPDHGETGVELLKQADVALYSAKAAGQDRMMVFEPHMRAEMQTRASMLSLARDAVREDLLIAHYQPKLEFASGRIVGFEALLRWRHPEEGLQLPETIGAAFEDIELAGAISDRMIDAVIADVRSWLDRGVAFGHVAINASVAEFRRGDFAGRLLRRLERAGVPSDRVQVEVTETVFLGRGAEYVEQALRELSEAGVRIALDDFGTGYASLSHLKQFPVDVLKIDRSFIRDLEHDPGDAAIIRAVINLGRSLGISVVAEGVETEAQHCFLATQGCDFGQGFLYGKAVPAERVPDFVRDPVRHGAFRAA
jgi:diguanylate cyclase (GGDEF)-like protein/PAS domain S-box-containing protein